MSVKLLAVIQCDMYDCEEKAQVTAEVSLCSNGVEIEPDLPEGWDSRHLDWSYKPAKKHYCPKHNTMEKRGY